MNILVRKPVITWICVTLFLIQSGCATSPRVAPAPSEDIGQNFGTIGVVSGRFTPKFRFQGPEPVKGAGVAAVLTSMDALETTWSGCQEVIHGTAFLIVVPIAVAYVCTAATPFVAIGGALHGGSNSDAAKANRVAKAARGSEVAELRSVIDPALAALANEKPLHRRLLEHARTQAYHAVVSVKDRGPTSPRKRARYKTLTSRGIDTVLEVTVPRLEVTPYNALVLTAHVRLIRVTDNEALYANTYSFETAPQTVWQWTANGGEGLRAALVNGCQGIADEIADDLFSSSPLPVTDPLTSAMNPQIVHTEKELARQFNKNSRKQSYSDVVGSSRQEETMREAVAALAVPIVTAHE